MVNFYSSDMKENQCDYTTKPMTTLHIGGENYFDLIILEFDYSRIWLYSCLVAKKKTKKGKFPYNKIGPLNPSFPQMGWN